MNWLLEPLQFVFIRSALLAIVLTGTACACVGVYVVLRRMAFIGDALAHTVLPGVVTAYLRGWNLYVGALAAGMVTALAIGWLARREELREDTAIGVVFTGMFALGILLISTVRSFRDFTHLLFGNLLGVTGEDLTVMAVVVVLVLAVLALLHKELVLSSYDPVQTEMIGVRADTMRLVLLLLLALTVVTSIQVVGVILTSALLVTPAAAASLLTRRIAPMMGIATLIAIGSGVVGLYASYYANVASGAAVVLTCTLCFGIAWLIHTLRVRRARG